jgi:hypothetical protein
MSVLKLNQKKPTGSGGEVTWSDVTSKPSTFPPSAHTHTISDVTSLQTTLDGKASSSHTHIIGDVTGLQTALDGKASSTHTHPQSDITNLTTDLAAKQATLVSGTNIRTINGETLLGSGNIAIGASLSSVQSFCTAETTLSATTYADITGASISLTAGTWLILATANGSSQTTTATSMIVAITDGANAVIAEAAQDIAAGTATVRTWGNLSLSAIVSPTGTTTYKLRGARGQTTRTGNCIISDGTGQGTANNVSNNSDKSTSIRAIKIA